MFQQHPYQNNYPMDTRLTLPPLSQITRALPFPQQQSSHSLTLPQPQQIPQYHHQQLQQSFHSPPQPAFQQYPPQYPKPQQQPHQQPVEEAKPSPPHSPVSPKYANKQPLDRCTCKHDGNHIPRPRNAFILFRQQHHQSVLDEGNVIKTNPDVSRELGKRWRDLSLQEKDYWNRLAEEEKKKHAEKYPGYRYIPRRFGKKGGCPFCKSKQSAKAAVGSASSVSPSPVSPQSQQLIDSRQRDEEHAVAQSFLSLRNQPMPNIQSHFYTSQPQYRPHYQTHYHTQDPVPQRQQTHHLPSLSKEITRPYMKSEFPEQSSLPFVSTIKHDITNFDSGRSATASPASAISGTSASSISSSSASSSHKAGSIASFLN